MHARDGMWDDMVLVASGPHFAHYLRDSYKQVLKALKQANMQVNPKKTVVICNDTYTKNKLKRAWRAVFCPQLKSPCVIWGLTPSEIPCAEEENPHF
eukprot:4910729-Amphidinium_carterae.1